MKSRKNSFAEQEWLAADADGRKAGDPQLAEGSACDDEGCTLRKADGGYVAFSLQPSSIADDCERADVVVTRTTPPADCAAMVISLDELHDAGIAGEIDLRHVVKLVAHPHGEVCGDFRKVASHRKFSERGLAGDGHAHLGEHVVFERDGKAYRLQAAREGDHLWFVFRDGTSGRTTHAGARSLLSDLPDATGQVVLDFNKAVTLPCAYTPYATCPLAPRQNRLDLAITAGERLYEPSSTPAAGAPPGAGR